MRKRFGELRGIPLVIVALLFMAGSSRAWAVNASPTPVKQVAIATPARDNDYGWNQQGVLAARRAAASVGARVVVADGIGYDNVEPVLGRLARGGASFVIAQASGFNTIAPRVAQQYRVPIITYDSPKNLQKSLVSDIETSSQQGAYLAGILAAKTTRTGTLGIVISASDTNWYKQTGGFVAGARSVKKGIKFRFAQIGQAAYDDAAGGKRVAQAVIADGADVVFGMGDGASFGYLQAVETAKEGHKVWFIDVIGNKTPIDKKHVLLSSVLWNFTPIFKRAIHDIQNGTYGTHLYSLNDSTGISLLKTPYITPALWKLIEYDRQAIAAGKIHGPRTPTESKDRQILKGP